MLVKCLLSVQPDVLGLFQTLNFDDPTVRV